MKAPPVAAGSERWTMVLLGVTLVVVGGFLVQGLLAQRAHRLVLDTAMNDFAAFAAERVAAAVDQEFTALFLDQIRIAAAADAEWTVSGNRPAPSPGRGVPEGAIPLYFSYADGELVPHGAPDTDSILRWAATRVEGHSPGYLRPAPYSALRGAGPLTLVYRKESGYGGEAIYGFVVDLSAFEAWYADIAQRTPVLPRSFEDEDANADVLSIGFHLTPDESPLYRIGSPAATEHRAWAFAPKAGRLAIGVELDEARARPLMPGSGTGTGLPILAVLSLLTLGLLALSVRLVQRTAHVAEVRERFVANVSHDLRTPITQIRMFSESLLSGRLTTASDRERALNAIHKQAQILSSLVTNVLHASGQPAPLVAESVELGPLLQEVLENLEPSARQAGIRLWGETTGERHAGVDRLAFMRIVSNLVDNAIRHAKGATRVHVAIEANSEGVTISVEDDGEGLAAELHDRAFQRFESFGSGDHTGAGLGLAVVADLARRHGGGARLDATDGGGLRAIVELADVTE